METLAALFELFGILWQGIGNIGGGGLQLFFALGLIFLVFAAYGMICGQ